MNTKRNASLFPLCGVSQRRNFSRAQAFTVALLLMFVFTVQAKLPGFAETRNLSGLTTDSLSIASGDINGDDAPDIITGSSNNTLWLNLNDGEGYYPTASQIGAESSPVLSIRLADLDADGDLDLVGATANKVFLYHNVSGQFSDYAAIGPTEGSVSIAAIQLADVNNDGKPDVIIGVNGGQSAVFLNNGSGGFFYGNVNCAQTSQYHCFGSPTQTVGALSIGDMGTDGKADIVVGRNIYTQNNYVFFNDGVGNFPTGAILPSPTFNTLRSLALGDLNGDGLLDVVSKEINTNTSSGYLFIYFNTGSGSFASPVQISTTFSTNLLARPALLDIDLDSDLDIIFSMQGKQIVFLNDGAGNFFSGEVNCDAPPANAFCFARSADYITDFTVVDLENDGDLDLAAVLSNNSNILYINDGSANLPRSSGVQVNDIDTQPASLALGDLNGDGWLDVVAGTENGAAIFTNLDGSLTLNQDLASGENYQDIHLADLDNDNDLDILASLANNRLVVFFNNSGNFLSGGLDCGNSNVTCLGNPGDKNINAAIGDMDGDGDLDILANRSLGDRMLYLNDGSGGFGTSRTFALPAVGVGGDIAIADLDADGDLDIILVHASSAIPGYIYLNDGQGNFHTGLVNCASLPDNVRCFDNGRGTSLNTADLNGDGALDIIVGKATGQSKLYLNDGQGNFAWTGSGRSFGGMETARGIAILDGDGDGDLDIAAANGSGQADTLYLNDGVSSFGALAQVRQFGSTADVLSRVAGGDMNHDGLTDLVTLEYAGARSVVSIVTNYARSAHGSARLPDNAPYISLNRPGLTPQADGYSTAQIIEASQVSFNYTLYDLQSQKVSRVAAYFSPDGGGKWYPALPAAGVPVINLAASPDGTTHTYTWDTAASGFFGKSDRVVLRMLAFSTTYPMPWSYSSAVTYPFRMRGMQVRVMQGATPIQGAMVLRRSGSSASYEYILDGAGNPQRTNANGYLEGRGELRSGDGLIALALEEQTERYTVYHTNSVPTPQGATGFTISAFGVQSIQVSAQHPLVLFNLTISLQWDARSDPAYLDRLNYDLQTASQRLYDWSNGQIALGELTIYQSRGLWNDALVRIYANNRFRPTAMKGGIVSDITVDPQAAEITYAPGQIHMGAVWNRYGTPGNNLEQDWPRALAHEINHYALYMDDNYLGLDDGGNVIPVDTCPSVMSDPYRKDAPYDEYHPATAWDAECAQTLSNRLTGRSDWETLSLFYPWVTFTGVNTGPNGQPLNVTKITFIDPVDDSTALADPTFYLTQDGSRVEPGRQSRAFLFQDNWAIDLGKPTTDHLLARGARPGDRVCMYEPEAGRVGCETVTAGDEQITLTTFSAWQPLITVNPLSSTTIQVSAAGLPAGLSLSARLYPVMNAAGAAQPMNYAGGVYA
ncbi:MAG TPA: VCBS repeat-containing protein, partial [Anaerolineaceae bacterium]|nr:VCBS repeat-containing protein [Anaerolineaceae bacterium]